MTIMEGGPPWHTGAPCCPCFECEVRRKEKNRRFTLNYHRDYFGKEAWTVEEDGGERRIFHSLEEVEIFLWRRCR